MSYLAGRTAHNLPDGPAYLLELDQDLRVKFAMKGVEYPGLRPILENPEWSPLRVSLCRYDPLLFAIIFTPHIIMNKWGKITFGDFHLALCRHAQTWALPLAADRGPRDVFVAPRGMGKSAWLMRILPLWAAAYGHSSKGRARCRECKGRGRTVDSDGLPTIPCVKCQATGWVKAGPFILLLSATQEAVIGHVNDLVAEITDNETLKTHFPDLTQRRKVPRTKFASLNGTMIVATSMETRLRGLNIANRRPDLIVCDDIDVDKASERIITFITDQLSRKIELLAEDARFVIAGTTTVYRGVIHQLLMRRFDGERNVPKEVLEWTNRWETHYFEPIVEDEPGFERSCWPGRWSLEHIKKVRREQPQTYELEWLNRPVPQQGAWWLRGEYKRLQEGYDSLQRFGFTWPRNSDETVDLFIPEEVGIFLDPCMIDKKTSDASAFCVAAYDRIHHRVAIIHTEEHIGLVGPALDRRGLELAREYNGTYWSPNFGVFDGTNGGSNMRAALATWGLELELIMVHFTETSKLAGAVEKMFRGKGQRIARSAMHYRQGRVAHLGELAVESQQTAWVGDESIIRDDLVDVVSMAVLWWLDPEWVRPPSAPASRWHY